MTSNFDPGPQIAQIGAISLGTPDLEKSLTFFRDLLGMEVVERTGGVVYLRGYMELVHHSLILFENPTPVVDSYSLRVQRREDVERFHSKLLQQEIEVLELPSGRETGRGEAIRFIWPGAGHPIELFYDITKPAAPAELRSKLPSNSSKRRGLGVRRIDHFNVQCEPQQVRPAEQWLRETLGFKRREFIRIPESDTLLASWMSVTPQVHDIALVANPNEKPGQLHHVAFNLENFSDLLTAADILKDHDVQFDVGPGKHGIGQALYLYVRDPGSGHRIELYAGGYLIFDPDWEAIEWTPASVRDGLTFYGDSLAEWDAENDPMAPTTDAAPLHSELRSAPVPL
ncbi:VOC family protein [Rhodococcus sp. IEGM 1307]|jgi:catechol 2,3-dioxygenase|uniref:VOC family protein n=1 Tax=Rhodococcus sp. IEGM 1307 TaxID=3047091 RepID=UPI0024B80BF4|nr:VOC family protein [Rhodococcus sp. IEGM 1307]MDI9973358.1 VOC family protein [Rhodococcus sp. IEGM 1307]